MKFLIIGANGMLGKMLVHKLKEKKHHVITAARNNADIQIDLLKDMNEIVASINKEQPDVVINTAAIINLLECESNPERAYLINGRFPALVAEVCDRLGIYFVQISTDHYYTGDVDKVHSEDNQIQLLNEYARTKYIGEILTNLYKNTLIVRTNIVGFKKKKDNPTFIEWVLSSLEENKNISGFVDFYTSSIDVEHFSGILYELILKKITGTVNIGTSNVVSKYCFILEIAKRLGKEHLVDKNTLQNLKQKVNRADSLGLDIQKLSKIIGVSKIPSSDEVIDWILEQYKMGELYELSK